MINNCMMHYIFLDTEVKFCNFSINGLYISVKCFVIYVNQITIVNWVILLTTWVRLVSISPVTCACGCRCDCELSRSGSIFKLSYSYRVYSVHPVGQRGHIYISYALPSYFETFRSWMRYRKLSLEIVSEIVWHGHTTCDDGFSCFEVDRGWYFSCLKSI